MDDAIDRLIKQYLDGRGWQSASSRSTTDELSSEELYLFIKDELKGERLSKVLNHLKNDADARELVSGARQLISTWDESSSQEPPPSVVKKAQDLLPHPTQPHCPHCGKTITAFKNPLKKQVVKNAIWLILAVAAYLLSFGIKRYFFQFVAAALFFGIKWIIEQRSTKTQILVYKALEEGGEGKGGDLPTRAKANNFKD